MKLASFGTRIGLLLCLVIVQPTVQLAWADSLTMDCASLLSRTDAAACEDVQQLLRSLAQAKTKIRPENRSLPVDLTCPSASGGVLDFLQKSPSGISIRTRVSFDGAKPVSIKGELFIPEKKQWIAVIDGQIAALTDPGDASRLRNNIDLTSRLRNSVCLGPPSVRDAFFRGLAANKTSLEAR